MWYFLSIARTDKTNAPVYTSAPKPLAWGPLSARNLLTFGQRRDDNNNVAIEFVFLNYYKVVCTLLLHGICVQRRVSFLSSGSWQMRLAENRRPWKRKPLPNCRCPSRAESPGTVRPLLPAILAVTWRLLSRPPSLHPPHSAAAHLQVRAVPCVGEVEG